MRIVFIGSVEFSLRTLEHLLKMDADIVGVCTLSESKFNTDHVDLSSICEAHNIPTLLVDDINSTESITWINDKSPDVVFCFGWSKLLGKELLNIAALGVIGFHPAALPANRGRHPLVWALVLGLDKTASTFFFMDADADNGDILSQSEIIINFTDDARSLYDKVINTALGQIETFVPQLANGKYIRTKQNQELGNSWRKRSVADGKIDWRMSANSIHNLVRGLTKPYVGAHFILDNNEIKVWKTIVICDVPKNIEPGKVMMLQGRAPVIKCGDDAIALLETEPLIDIAVGSYL